MKQSNITIYRGSHQIGGCSTQIQTPDHRIVIDFGANLPDTPTDEAPTDQELTDAVFDGRPCDGVLFTHYHNDHMGMFQEIPEDIPLYIGPTAKKIQEILYEKLDAAPISSKKGLPRIQSMHTYYPKARLSFGDIQVTPFIVDHSALDAYMFLIEIDGKKILFTGDFRDHGIVGENDTLEETIKTHIGKVDILITEGTLLSRIEEAKRNPIRTEAQLGERARALFKENKESVILVSSTNLDSIMEFYHALPDEMGFVCDPYQAKLILTAIRDKGPDYQKYNLKTINGKPRPFHIVSTNKDRDMEGLGEAENCIKADFSILKDTGFTMLARESNDRFKGIMKYFPDPLIIYSKWKEYRNADGPHARQKIIDFIGDHRVEDLHVSGHASVEAIAKLMRLTDPDTIIPMHTQCADTFHQVPLFAPYKDRVKVLKDGERLSIS